MTRGAQLEYGISKPPGMSGCGLWQGPHANELWTPEKYKLIAIQGRWPQKNRQLQATQIIHWLRQFWKTCSDLRSGLEVAFPDQKFDE